MKILVLTSFDLFPPVHGGSSVAYNWIKQASSRHDVTALISRLYSQGGQPDLPGDNVHIHYCRPSVFDRLRVLSFWVNPHYYRTAERLCHELHPDVVQCETLWPAFAALRLRKKHRIPVVCVEYNVEADKSAALGRPAPVTGLVAWGERVACQQADHVVTLTHQDRQQIARRYGVPSQRCSTILPCPDLAGFAFNPAARALVRSRYGLADGDAMLTFVGNLEYEPNQQAVHRIADYVYPAVLRRHPSAYCVVIGQGAERLSECRRERLSFTGYLSRSELVAHLCATDAFVVPVETGAGMRVKIPEATACGRAVVATRKAAEGLESFAEDEIVRTEAVDEGFLAAVLRLIEEPAWRNGVGERAQLRTQQVFDWSKALTEYDHIYSRLAATSGRGKAA